MIFGTKRLKNIGSDLGGALKGFKNAMDNDETDDEKKSLDAAAEKSEATEESKSDSKQ